VGLILPVNSFLHSKKSANFTEMSDYSQPIFMNFNHFYLNLAFSLNWRWWEQRFFSQKPSVFGDLNGNFKSRGIVRYFDRKSIKLLK
jgi:hypothetical protein